MTYATSAGTFPTFRERGSVVSDSAIARSDVVPVLGIMVDISQRKQNFTGRWSAKWNSASSKVILFPWFHTNSARPWHHPVFDRTAPRFLPEDAA